MRSGMTNPPGEDRAALRQRMRAARRRMDPARRREAAEAAAANLSRLGLPRPRSRVAFYLPMDGELDPGPAVLRSLARGCEVFVPVITSFRARHMRFVRWTPELSTRRNRWEIREPEGTGIDGRWLDLAVVPCVAFDPTGMRIGLGAGFYDRHFAWLAGRSTWRRPRLVGLAFDFQRVDRLRRAEWDVPLWGIVTDHGVYGDAAGLLQPTRREEPE
jgi:5-formyltetrahydrofolate cyclo-ligase